MITVGHDTTSPLRVTPPDYPGSDVSREATHQKLARNVAALFGIPVPGSRYPELCWYANYPEVTIKDLTRGTPPGWDPKDDKDTAGQQLDKIPIASATLSKFGPDAKAASVLAGANTLLDPLMATLTDLLEITYFSEDGQPLADATRLGLWAALQLDIYMAQPALMWAIYQARTIQRATDHSWTVQVDPDVERFGSPDLRRWIEFKTREDDDPSLNPRSCPILDDLMNEVVRPTVGPPSEGIESIPKIVDNTITRFITHLTRDSAHPGWSRLRGTSPGRRTLDIYLHRLSAQSTFFEENLRIFRKVQPYDAEGNVWEDYNSANDTHWRRLIPRIPSTFEARRLDRSDGEGPSVGQVALIRALREALRTLGEAKESLPSMATREVRHHLLKLNDLSSTILGPAHHETLRTWILYLELLERDLGINRVERWDRCVTIREADDETVRGVKALVEISSDWPPGEWLECWDQVSTPLSHVIFHEREAGRIEASQELSKYQVSVWLSAFTNLGIDLTRADLVASGSPRNDLMMGLATPLHDGMTALIREDLPKETVARGRLLANDYVLPVRSIVSRHRRTDRPLRLTLQVLVGHYARCAEQGEEGVVQQLADLRSQLAATAQVQSIESNFRSLGRSDSSYLPLSHLIPLRTLAWAGIVLVEQGHTPPASLLDEIEWQLQAFETILDNEMPDRDGTSTRERQYADLMQRWEQIKKRESAS